MMKQKICQLSTSRGTSWINISLILQTARPRVLNRKTWTDIEVGWEIIILKSIRGMGKKKNRALQNVCCSVYYYNVYVIQHEYIQQITLSSYVIIYAVNYLISSDMAVVGWNSVALENANTCIRIKYIIIIIIV